MSPAIEQAAREAGAMIARLNIAEDESRLAALRAELAKIGERDREVREELQRLESAIAHFTGPDPQKVAEAIMAGASLAEATAATDSKQGMEEKRAALRSALGPIRDRSDALNGEIRELRGRIASEALQVVKPLVDAINADARAAAEVLIETHAARKAIAIALGVWVDGEAAGRTAADAVTGGTDKLLPPLTSASVPDVIAKALAALQARCSIVSTPPAAIML